MTKRCRKCGIVKDADKFYKNNHHKDGLTSYCKKCCYKRSCQYAKTKKGKKVVNEAAKRYQRTERGKKVQQKYQKSLKRKNCVLKSKFGITLEQYDEMFENQNGVCAICGLVDATGRRLAVDHNHETGKIRGLLCVGCNARLGTLEHKTWRPLAEKYLYDNRS